MPLLDSALLCVTYIILALAYGASSEGIKSLYKKVKQRRSKKNVRLVYNRVTDSNRHDELSKEAV